MFTTEVGQSGFAPWLIQQLGVPIVSFVWAALINSIPGAGPGMPGDLFKTMAQFVSFIVTWGFAFIFGLVIQRYVPGAARTGRWIWLLPTLLFIAAFVADLRLLALQQVLANFFWPEPKGGAGLLVILVTYPTWSCLSYSLAVALKARRTVVDRQ